ncbi:MAG: type 4a pilus biogenesis protein PilO [Candidatus Riflebacteria bacterium]|nr:type 4a pilus biogenesis protein PilO [Candidatus Riflebacteria bacterium]
MNRLIAAAAIISIILVGYDYFQIKPGRNAAIYAQRDANTKLQADLDTALKAKSEIEAVSSEIEELKKQTAELLQKLPQKEEAGTLLEQITKITTGKGFSMEKVTPGATRLAEATIKADNDSGKVVYTEIEINIEMQSTFKELGKYLESIEQLPRLVDVTGFKSKPLDEGNRLVSQMNVKTYVYGGE